MDSRGGLATAERGCRMEALRDRKARHAKDVGDYAFVAARKDG